MLKRGGTMELKLSHTGKVLIAKILEEKFTNVDANEFRETMEEQIKKDELKIILDLAKVKYMDSSALGSVITTRNRLEEHAEAVDSQGILAVANLGKNVKTIFDVFKMDSILKIYDDLDSAVNDIEG